MASLENYTCCVCMRDMLFDSTLPCCKGQLCRPCYWKIRKAWDPLLLCPLCRRVTSKPDAVEIIPFESLYHILRSHDYFKSHDRCRELMIKCLDAKLDLCAKMRAAIMDEVEDVDLHWEVEEASIAIYETQMNLRELVAWAWSEAFYFFDE